MTLPVPSQDTFAVGETLTAALMNKNVRDAITFLLNPPMAILYQNTGQGIANNAALSLIFDSETYDNYNGHSNTVNNTRYTAQVAGWYHVIGQLSFPGNTTGLRDVQIRVTGVAPAGQPQNYTANSANQDWQVSAFVYCNVGDFIELYVVQTSGGTLTTTGASSGVGAPMMMVRWIHA